MTAVTSLPVIDPQTLTEAQRSGRACAVCGKRWPRPRTHVGTLPCGVPVLACDGHIVVTTAVWTPVAR